MDDSNQTTAAVLTLDEAFKADQFRQRQIEQLREALEDMWAGWRYIRRHHGDLDGVGWERCEEAARAALGKEVPYGE